MINNKIIIITGSTASSKSQSSLLIAKKVINPVIINADINQCYKGIELLSDSPTMEDKTKVPHRLYNFLPITENFSVAKWVNIAKDEINKAFKNKKTPIIVGGSVMYIHSLINGLSNIPDISESEKRFGDFIYNNTQYNDFLKLIQKIDKKTPTDKQRLIRNFCLLYKYGKSLREFTSEGNIKYFKDNQFIKYAIMQDREIVYDKINKRFSNNFDIYVNEVKNIKKLINIHNNSIKAHGFREIADFFEGKITKEECITEVTKQIRNYAKRQMTWIRNKFKDFNIFESAEDLVENFNKILKINE